MGAPSEKLPRSRIVRRRSIFDATRARGKRTANRWMTLSVLPRDPAQSNDDSRVAFLTPKRLGGAVVRNRLRRRMREIYRRVVAAPADDVYLIWIARPPAVELAFEELKECMVTLARRAENGRMKTEG
jgi:ribonuclease P protein component